MDEVDLRDIYYLDSEIFNSLSTIDRSLFREFRVNEILEKVYDVVFIRLNGRVKFRLEQ